MATNNINLTYDDIRKYSNTIIRQMKKQNWTPSVVVGLTRGGLLPGVLISHQLNIPMCSLDVSFRDNIDTPFTGQTSTWIPEEIENGHNVLVVDDINDTGKTFEWIRDDWMNTVSFIDMKKRNGDNWPWNKIKFAAIIHNEPSSTSTDFFGKKINKNKDPSWIVFPWEKSKKRSRQTKHDRVQ